MIVAVLALVFSILLIWYSRNTGYSFWGRSDFCLKFQPDPQGPGVGPAHLPLGPDQPALFTA